MIVIIGILAAVAIPKFQNMSDSANIAATKGVAGELAGAAAIEYARQKATGSGVYTAPACTNTAFASLLSSGVPAGYTIGDATDSTVGCSVSNNNMVTGATGKTVNFPVAASGT